MAVLAYQLLASVIHIQNVRSYTAQTLCIDRSKNEQEKPTKHRCHQTNGLATFYP